jgi:hypothetical protein
MKAHGVRISDMDKRLGQDMLPGVLLHMIEPTIPVNRAVDEVIKDLVAKDVHDGAIFFTDENVNDRHFVNVATIGRLPARGWVEEGMIKDQGRPIVQS